MTAGLRLPLALVCCLVHGFAAAALPCVARSGEHTAALVELYTSTDCSGCGPADRWLSGLGRRFAADRVVPLALHVDYRDYLGRKDRRAQRRLTVLQRMALVYTPQVILQGRDFSGWHSSKFEDALARVNARPARVRLRLEIRGVAASGLDVVAEAEFVEAWQGDDAALYVAAIRSRGQDHVALEWQGPLAARPDGRFSLRRSLALLPGATPANSGVAAFVQDRRTGEVLQAVLLAACSP